MDGIAACRIQLQQGNHNTSSRSLVSPIIWNMLNYQLKDLINALYDIEFERVERLSASARSIVSVLEWHSWWAAQNDF